MGGRTWERVGVIINKEIKLDHWHHDKTNVTTLTKYLLDDNFPLDAGLIVKPKTCQTYKFQKDRIKIQTTFLLKGFLFYGGHHLPCLTWSCRGNLQGRHGHYLWRTSVHQTTKSLIDQWHLCYMGLYIDEIHTDVVVRWKDDDEHIHSYHHN